MFCLDTQERQQRLSILLLIIILGSRRILGRVQMPLNRLFVNMALRAAAQDMNMVSQSPGDTRSGADV